MAEAVRTFDVSEEDDGIRLDRWFKRHLPETNFNTVSRWARTGQLRVDGNRVKPGDRVEMGQEIRVPPPESAVGRSQKVRPALTLEEAEVDYVRDMVIGQTDDAYILNKPPGLATQGGTGTMQHLDRLLNGLADEKNGKPKLVHRLDKDTSGVILVARGPKAAAHFSKSFSGRTAKKVYWALVTGVPEVKDGMIDLPLSKQPGTGGEKMHVDEQNGASAKTLLRVIDRAGNRASFVELQPLTGRTHQLRAHMAAVGHPIVGDSKYGGTEAFLTGGISRKMHLHARRLKIDAPRGKTIDHKASLPDHFAESMEMLGFEVEAGDWLPLTTPDPADHPETKAKRKAAHAKAYRKSRKGERRARGDAPRAKGARGAKTNGKSVKAGGKPVKAGGKPVRKPRQAGPAKRTGAPRRPGPKK